MCRTTTCRKSRFVALSILLVAILVGGLTACKPAEDAGPTVPDGGAEWTWLQTQKPILDAKREELRRLRAGELPTAEAPGEGEIPTGKGETEIEPPTPPTPEELAARVDALAAEVQALSDEFSRKLVTFINSQEIEVGQDYNETQRQAIDWKIDEDIFLAQEYIDRGGDYQRAIDIYSQSMALDPGNVKLTAAIAAAEEDRYMSEERFSQVKKGMTEAEVRALLGQAKLSNVRDFDNGVVGWFYKKADGGAAGVFFRKNKQGEPRVYEANFDAVERQVVGEEGEQGIEG